MRGQRNRKSKSATSEPGWGLRIVGQDEAVQVVAMLDKIFHRQSSCSEVSAFLKRLSDPAKRETKKGESK